MDEITAKQFQELRNEIGALQVALFSTLAEVKVLTMLSEILWEKQEVQMAGGRTISEVVRLLKKEIIDSHLSSLADTDMKLASKLKRRLDKYFKN